MAVILSDAWYQLGCGCELSELGGMLVDVRCRAHVVLVPPEDARAMLGPAGRYGRIYGPIDVDVPKLAKGGGA